jgi:hypothetical protein
VDICLSVLKKRLNTFDGINMIWLKFSGPVHRCLFPDQSNSTRNFWEGGAVRFQIIAFLKSDRQTDLTVATKNRRTGITNLL